jgi:hypothetical protein
MYVNCKEKHLSEMKDEERTRHKYFMKKLLVPGIHQEGSISLGVGWRNRYSVKDSTYIFFSQRFLSAQSDMPDDATHLVTHKA